ncbi:hypothetical protein CHH28_11420 [Bacterioplanes sanyensis]|uniref:Porin domain-containing protein n=1 Tax=Bacterioplanes sanyensis TaxID=1249553 RepID=A0A222FJM0_9GAMM|nr:porin [Bacterioplanes sanyensis]ASP39247.1 hypothetical protein CHH28_11420 [Bacterioplanes sanyensis]
MKHLASCLMLSCAASSSLASATLPVQAEAYGSVRLGFDVIDAGTQDDGGNGRDFLSRVGVKATLPLQPGLTASGLLEYGTRAENGVDFKQNDAPGLRQAYIGLKGNWGEVRIGSQTMVWHSFVRGAYFSDANDTLRQGTIRDDDLLQYFYRRQSFRFGAALQAEGQDGDSIDQYQLAAEYSQPQWKAQLAWAKDQRGEYTGKLWGARVWLMPSDNWTLSAYRHQADRDYDFYTGSTTGNVRLRDASIEGSVNGVPGCSNEERSSTGVYLSYRSGIHQWHGRYALDECDVAGEVNSKKAEYVAHLHPQARLWLAYEVLDNDATRRPATSSGDSMSEIQLGLRLDF